MKDFHVATDGEQGTSTLFIPKAIEQGKNSSIQNKGSVTLEKLLEWLMARMVQVVANTWRTAGSPSLVYNANKLHGGNALKRVALDRL